MNKKLIIILSSLAVIVLLGAVGVYFMTSGGDKRENRLLAEEDYKEISPEDVGFSYELRDNHTGMTISFDKLEDVTTIEYDISYTREVDGPDGPVEVPGGVPGEFDVSDKSEFEAEIDFGTCSSGVCVFDEILSDNIDVTVKVEFDSGEKGVFEEKIPLN